MNPVIIACDTLSQELALAMEAVGCAWPVRTLPGGDHNVPATRRSQIQEALDGCREHDTVLLAMTLCGGSVAGLRTGDFRLVVPRCDDCITLLLGPEVRAANPGTYFLTEGWLRGRDNIGAEYAHCVEKYGENRAKRVFSSMLAHYRHLAMIDAGTTGPAAEATIRGLAETLGLEYRCLPGSCQWLIQLLQGPWPEDRFLVIPPHSLTQPKEGGTHGT